MFFKKFLVVLSVICVASAKPGYLGSYGAYPPAVSHVSRVDYHSKPVAVAAPVYSSGLGYGGHGLLTSGYGGFSGHGGALLNSGYGSGYGSTYGSAFGSSAHGYGYPLAHSYANRVDLPGTPIAIGIASGYGHSGYYGGSGYGLGGWN